MDDTAPVDAPLGGGSMPLDAGWELLLTGPSAYERPEAVADAAFVPAVVPGTVASSLRALGRFSFEMLQDFDAQDAWYRCRFARPRHAAGARVRLCFDGLATLADVYLNGARLFASENMFVARASDVTDALGDDNELAIRFRALLPELKNRKARPRWKTKLVEHQQLRFFRTSLLGRTPGFCPAVSPLGPFRPVRLEVVENGFLRSPKLSSRRDGSAGVVALDARLGVLGGRDVESATLVAGVHEAPLARRADVDGVAISGEVIVPDAPPWWPHTHGPSPLVAVELVVRLSDGTTVRHSLGRVGFRTLEFDTSGDGFVLSVNGTRVFCRGVCWTPLDVVSLTGPAAAYRAALEALRDAGMNMIRIGGTMLYEADAFHDACDELGILVWQDFMFANMDYPCADAAFMASVRSEAAELLQRLAPRPSTVVFCGSSESEQQAAMLGLAREAWTNELFSTVLPEMVREACRGVRYWPSSPTGGTVPFQVNAGISHYYGVGAYLRAFEDARRANVRFTPECLAFANVPEETTLERLLPEGTPPVHHPLWKARVPRDRGAGWDFDDVRDHYLERLFGVSARDLRYGDSARYLELSRVASAEAMHRTFSEWRRPASSCNGALVWFYRDFWPGAGWGVIDATGTPKAAYWYLRRVLQPRALLVSDEGLDGLVLHAINELDAAMDVELTATLYRLGEIKVAEGRKRLGVPGRTGRSVPVQALLETFIDTTYAYRFGPPSHDLVVATMTDLATGGATSAFYFPLGFSASREADVGLDVVGEAAGEGEVTLTVSAKRFAQAVFLELRGGTPSDNYFNVAPGTQTKIRVRLATAATKLQGAARALNAHATAKLSLR